MTTSEKTNYLLIGYGYWGPKIAKSIFREDHSNLAVVVDSNTSALKKAKNDKFSQHYFDNYKNLDLSILENIDVIVIATKEANYEILQDLAYLKKSFLVTKPVSKSISEFNKIINLQKKHNIEIFADYTFLFCNKVRKIKELVSSKGFGDLQYIYSNRSNLGIIQKHQNVIWDLAPHDLSIVTFVTGKHPTKGSVFTSNPLKHIDSETTMASVFFKYGNSFDLYLNLSWLSAEKIRYMVFSGTKQTIVYDDNVNEKNLILYNQQILNKNIDFVYTKDKGEVIKFEKNEPLQQEIKELSNYIKMKKNRPETFIENSRENIKALENLRYIKVT